MKDLIEKLRFLSDKYDVKIYIPTHDAIHFEGEGQNCRSASGELFKVTLEGFESRRLGPTFQNLPVPRTELGRAVRESLNGPFFSCLDFGSLEKRLMAEYYTTKSPFGFGCPLCEVLLDRYPEDRNEGGIE